MIDSRLKLMMLCGKQEHELCDHDSIAWNDHDENTVFNIGNYDALEWFCTETDLVLTEHLAKAPRNAQIKTI